MKISAEYYVAGVYQTRVSIFKALEIKRNHINNVHSPYTFYDTKNIVNQRELRPVREGKGHRRAHFKYIDGMVGNVNGNGQESISHQVAKDVISSMDEINLQIFDENVRIIVDKATVEYYKRLGENEYYIDVWIEFSRCSPASYYYKWNGRIAIEIFVTHAMDDSKKNDFKLHDIPCVQIDLSDKKFWISEENFNENTFKYGFNRYSKLFEEKIICSYPRKGVQCQDEDMKEKYEVLMNFEVECKNLKEEIELRKKEVAELEELKECLFLENKGLKKEAVNLKNYLENKKVISNYNALKKGYDNLSRLRNNEKVEANAEIAKLHEELSFEKNKPWYKKLMNR